MVATADGNAVGVIAHELNSMPTQSRGWKKASYAARPRKSIAFWAVPAKVTDRQCLSIQENRQESGKNM